MNEETASNAESRVEVSKADLPLHCPMKGTTLWNSHPRVFISIKPGQSASCPYCGTEYILVDEI